MQWTSIALCELECGRFGFYTVDVGAVERIVRRRADLKATIANACMSEDGNLIAMTTNLGDVLYVTHTSKLVLSGKEKVTVLGLDYGHIDVLNKEQGVLRLGKSSLNMNKTNKSDAYWLTCCISGDQNRYILGYGGANNVFVVECINCFCLFESFSMSSWSSARNSKTPPKMKSKEVWTKLDDDEEDDDDIIEEEPEIDSTQTKTQIAKNKIKNVFMKEEKDEKGDEKSLGDQLKKVIPFGLSSGCMLGGMLSMLDIYGVVTKKGQSKATMMRAAARAVSLNMLSMGG